MMKAAIRSWARPGAVGAIACLFILVLVGAVRPASPAYAQESFGSADMVMRIAAVVNDDIISVYDVEARTDLLIASARMPDTAEVRSRIRAQVLRALISETLKLQEGERVGVTVSDGDMDAAIRQVEQQNGLPPGGYKGFVNANGLDMDNALRQVRAEVAWIKAIRAQFGSQVEISQEQVDLVMGRLQAARGKPEHLAWEIYLPVENPSLDGRVRQEALELIDQLRQGAAFPALARQFSQSPSAAKGGLLGWVRQGELDPALEQALMGMAEGAISEPIRTAAGYHVLRLQDRRRTAQPDPDKTRLTISQLALPSRGPKAMSQSTRDEIKAVVAETVKTCEDLNALAQKLEAPNSGTVGTIPLSRLEGPMRDVLVPLGENEVSDPIRTPNGELLLMVCKRDVPGGMPSESEIRENLRRERLETFANRRLATLRERALIDIRI